MDFYFWAEEFFLEFFGIDLKFGKYWLPKIMISRMTMRSLASRRISNLLEITFAHISNRRFVHGYPAGSSVSRPGNIFCSIICGSFAYISWSCSNSCWKALKSVCGTNVDFHWEGKFSFFLLRVTNIESFRCWKHKFEKSGIGNWNLLIAATSILKKYHILK